jgi:hypothetical protein
MASRMPEAAGRGEGETCADGKVTWVVDRQCRPPTPQSRALGDDRRRDADAGSEDKSDE